MPRSRTPFLARHHLSLGADYALRLVRLFTDIFDGDVALALVFVAAAQAGTQHLRNTPAHFVPAEGEFFPDDLRRPISVSALARSLGLSVETTRRHVIRLVELGYAQRTASGGVLVTSEILKREEVSTAAVANLTSMRHLIRALSRAPEGR